MGCSSSKPETRVAENKSAADANKQRELAEKKAQLAKAVKNPAPISNQAQQKPEEPKKSEPAPNNPPAADAPAAQAPAAPAPAAPASQDKPAEAPAAEAPAAEPAAQQDKPADA
uniref:23 kDa sporozoite surface antigen n=1 Tax=Cryptosporidium parvum TaxID=5807 RepID=B1PWB4_CRYPV|nr:23 kDa sporozoite surface antigen [Cryptosporidium parvum]